MKRKRYTDGRLPLRCGKPSPERRWRRSAGGSGYRGRRSIGGRNNLTAWGAEIRRLKQLNDEENRKLKQLVADLTLDKAMLQGEARPSPAAA